MQDDKVPIAVRSRNRPRYLDITLRSLFASAIITKNVIIADDRSDIKIMDDYFYTDKNIKFDKSIVWPEEKSWRKRIGNIYKLENLNSIIGLNSKIPIIIPEKRKGVRGHIFWLIDRLMTDYPNAEYVVVVEDDIIFNYHWYTNLIKCYHKYKNEEGPYKSYQMGLLTTYDRIGGANKGKEIVWRGKFYNKKGKFIKFRNISGCVILCTRKYYEAAKEHFKATYHPRETSGDVHIQNIAREYRFNIAATYPSYAQHIGVKGIARPLVTKLRQTNNFKQPFVLANKISDFINISS